MLESTPEWVKGTEVMFRVGKVLFVSDLRPDHNADPRPKSSLLSDFILVVSHSS